MARGLRRHAAGRPRCGRGPRPGRLRRAATSSERHAAARQDCGDLQHRRQPLDRLRLQRARDRQRRQKKLGCKVTYPEVKEEVGWQGMSDGSIDTIVENWGHPDLVKKYINDQGTVLDAGLTGNDGIIGWYVPPWMARKPRHLDSTTSTTTRMFETSESGGKGQLLDDCCMSHQ